MMKLENRLVELRQEREKGQHHGWKARLLPRVLIGGAVLLGIVFMLVGISQIFGCI